MSIHFTKEEFTERKSKVIEELKKKELKKLSQLLIHLNLVHPNHKVK